MSVQPWTVSPSIERLKDRLRDEPIATADVLNALFEIHPEYGGGLAAKVRLERTPGEPLRYIDEILDVSRAVWAKPPQMLHGRMLVAAERVQGHAASAVVAGAPVERADRRDGLSPFH